MNVVLNGTPEEFQDGLTVTELVQARGARAERGTAVALNGEVVARSSWDETVLEDGDRVELLVAIGGG